MAKGNVFVSALLLAGPASAQLGPAATVPPLPQRAQDHSAHLSLPPPAVPVVLHVAPGGSDEGDGSAAHPFATPTRAQAAVRAVNAEKDVAVRLADGTYRLGEPLRFVAADGGQRGHAVRWEAEPGARPILSGGIPIAGWRLADQARGIWMAAIPPGADPRQLWIDGRSAPRAAVEAPHDAFAYHEWGMEIVDPAWRFLANLPGQHRIEVEHTGFWTDRHAMVDRIEGNRIIMQQPGWRNNLVGWDTIARPLSGVNGHLFFINAMPLLREAGQWFADPAAGRLYYKPRAGEDMARAEVELPRLEVLVSIAGSYETPIQDLSFSGLSFRHTSWLAPSGAEGYASQQSAAYIVGAIPDYPADPIRDCSWGCRAMESIRNHYRQQPAAVQVAAAARITFERNEFTQLGQVALGIGNNPDANASGIGLGASAIKVMRNSFTDLAGGAIMAGGVISDAHHPSRPEMGVRHIQISDNTIRNVSQEYREHTAILVTYATAPLIIHNEISGASYDGIDVGWGWGSNDPGGAPAFTSQSRAYYSLPGNPYYDTPTILRDTVILGNRVHDVKRYYSDGGAIYHLSADPGALIAENYVYDVPGGIGLYLDEGSRYVTVRDNVVSGVRTWLNLNSQGREAPARTAMDNTASGNWYANGGRNGEWSAYLNNRAVDNVEVKGGAWPRQAQDVMKRAGVRPEEPRP